MLASSIKTNNVLGIFASPAFFLDRAATGKKVLKPPVVTVIAQETRSGD